MVNAGREAAQGGRGEGGEFHLVLGSRNVQAAGTRGTSHPWAAGTGMASGMGFPLKSTPFCSGPGDVRAMEEGSALCGEIICRALKT